MDLWQLALYGVVSFLALQSLISLMSNHQHQYRQKLQAEDRAIEKVARKKAKKDAEEQAEREEAARKAQQAEEIAA